MMRTKRMHSGVAGLGTVVLLAGCSAPANSANTGSENAAYEEFAEMDDSTRMESLVDAAEAEGEVVVHLRGPDLFPEIKAAFESKYDIDVTLIYAGTTQVVQNQIFGEAAAGRPESDVVETYNHELNGAYSEEGVIAPLPHFLGEDALDPSFVSDYSVETFQFPFLATWNTNLVTDSDAPKSFADLDGGIWEDNLVMMNGYHPWYIAMHQQLTGDEGMSNEEFTTLFTTMASYASTTDSSNTGAAGIASAEYAGSPSIALVAVPRLGPDAPLAYTPEVQPVPLVPLGIGLISGAQNPAAGLLFTQWYLEEGLDIVVEAEFVDKHPHESDLIDVETVRADFSDIDSARLEEWRVAYDNLLRGAGPVLPKYVLND